MKIEIYGSKEEEKEIPLRLNLKSRNTGEVILQAVTEDGRAITNILKITPEGEIYRFTAVSLGLGLNLEIDGKVKTN